jgi:hypothetical protein
LSLECVLQLTVEDLIEILVIRETLPEGVFGREIGAKPAIIADFSIQPTTACLHAGLV